ncbi:uncharacterized protein SAPINGB_P005482 [Magnusiomyces paraingens]|uniref:Uncharacterized protein n=1 Tax=Magnusiomyces paraingens TaxID=2606893 RepID=A0A5E8C721_9ASCO|nr:uncharacterized protein SAPINGB_P005482 [Saprochaete ingens]VVT56996.1 unnamed protein product [Saprochaete ingens]
MGFALPFCNQSQKYGSSKNPDCFIPLCKKTQKFNISNCSSSNPDKTVDVTNSCGEVVYRFEKILNGGIPNNFVTKWVLVDTNSLNQVAAVNMTPFKTCIEVEDIIRKVVNKVQIKAKGKYKQFKLPFCCGSQENQGMDPNVAATAKQIYRWSTKKYHLERILNAACSIYPSPNVVVAPTQPKKRKCPRREIIGKCKPISTQPMNFELDLDLKKVELPQALASAFVTILLSWGKQKAMKMIPIPLDGLDSQGGSCPNSQINSQSSSRATSAGSIMSAITTGSASSVTSASKNGSILNGNLFQNPLEQIIGDRSQLQRYLGGAGFYNYQVDQGSHNVTFEERPLGKQQRPTITINIEVCSGIDCPQCKPIHSDLPVPVINTSYEADVVKKIIKKSSDTPDLSDCSAVTSASSKDTSVATSATSMVTSEAESIPETSAEVMSASDLRITDTLHHHHHHYDHDHDHDHMHSSYPQSQLFYPMQPPPSEYNYGYSQAELPQAPIPPPALTHTTTLAEAAQKMRADKAAQEPITPSNNDQMAAVPIEHDHASSFHIPRFVQAAATATPYFQAMIPQAPVTEPIPNTQVMPVAAPAQTQLTQPPFQAPQPPPSQSLPQVLVPTQYQTQTQTQTQVQYPLQGQTQIQTQVQFSGVGSSHNVQIPIQSSNQLTDQNNTHNEKLVGQASVQPSHYQNNIQNKMQQNFTQQHIHDNSQYTDHYHVQPYNHSLFQPTGLQETFPTTTPASMDPEISEPQSYYSVPTQTTGIMPSQLQPQTQVQTQVQAVMPQQGSIAVSVSTPASASGSTLPRASIVAPASASTAPIKEARPTPSVRIRDEPEIIPESYSAPPKLGPNFVRHLANEISNSIVLKQMAPQTIHNHIGNGHRYGSSSGSSSCSSRGSRGSGSDKRRAKYVAPMRSVSRNSRQRTRSPNRSNSSKSARRVEGKNSGKIKKGQNNKKKKKSGSKEGVRSYFNPSVKFTDTEDDDEDFCDDEMDDEDYDEDENEEFFSSTSSDEDDEDDEGDDDDDVWNSSSSSNFEEEKKRRTPHKKKSQKNKESKSRCGSAGMCRRPESSGSSCKKKYGTWNGSSSRTTITTPVKYPAKISRKYNPRRYDGGSTRGGSSGCSE